MAPHIIFLNLSILFPIIVWVVRLQNINEVYNLFIVHLFFGLLNEIIHLTIHSNTISTTSSLVYYFLETQCILYYLLYWSEFSSFFKKIFHIVFLVLLTINALLLFNVNGYIFYWLYMIILFTIIVLGIKTLVKVKIDISQKLIIIPIIVYSIYYIVLNVLMAFLFSKTTQALFIKLYDVIAIINFLSYISYSLALLWAPKKEKYL